MKLDLRDTMEVVPISEAERWVVHARERCVGQPCPFHNPSDHRMRTWPMHLRETTLIERICSHGVGHPDPDSVAYFRRRGVECMDVHGCDGCCHD